MNDFAEIGGKKSKTSYWIIYTAVFAVLITVVLAPFWATGRSLISAGDSTSQFYPAVVYAGEWYREVLSPAEIRLRPVAQKGASTTVIKTANTAV